MEEEAEEVKPVCVGHIDRHCGICGEFIKCHVIQTKSGPAIVCDACKKKKYNGVE